jgi:hypothetical protein
LLNIVGEDKRFVFVTKDTEINTNITIFGHAHSSVPIGDPWPPSILHIDNGLYSLLPIRRGSVTDISSLLLIGH